MKKRIEDVVWLAVENVPTILTIVFATYVIALAQTGQMPTEVLLQWVLAILGLIAVSELVERWRKLRKIESLSEDMLKMLQGRFGDRARAEDFFTKRLPSLEPYLTKAQDIRICGYSLQRTIRENSYIFAQRLKDGATIQVLIVNPVILEDKPVVSEPGEKHDPLGAMVAIKTLKWLVKQPEIKGSIQVKFMEEEPRFNIIAIDPDDDSGIIFVEFYPQRWVPGIRPRMELTSERDGFWYQYFKDQFIRIWDEYTLYHMEAQGQSELSDDKSAPQT